jgi:P27 family predicted phage terminase small subunit
MSIPKHLSAEARKIWRSIVAEYEISDTAGLKILKTSLEAYDRMQKARESIDKYVMLVKDRFDQPKAHPLLTIERDSRAAFLAGLKALNLDIEPLKDRSGRPSWGGLKIAN